MNFSEVVVARSAGEGEGKEAAVLIGCGGRIDGVQCWIGGVNWLQ